jgi:hypothetical protein
MTDTRNFTATVPLDTPFVAMMFVHSNPIYALDAVQTFTVRPDGRLVVQAIIQYNPCYNVDVPGKPFKVCMHCNNVLRANSRFVWTPTWYIDYTCEWRCNDGFQTDSNPLNPQCIPVTATAVPLQTIAVVLCALVLLIIGVALCNQKAAAVPDPPAPEVSCKPAEIIQFRENTITPMHIRVKMN